MASGENPDLYQARLMDDFRVKHGRPFNFIKCLVYLEDLPKFANHKDPSEVAQMEMEEECGVKTVVPDAVCPEGAKKAAKRQKLEELAGKSKDEANQRVDKVVAAIKDVHDSLKSKFAEESYEVELKSLQDQRDFFFKMGDNDGAKKANDELLALKKEFKAKKEEAGPKGMAPGVNKAFTVKFSKSLESGGEDDSTVDDVNALM